MASIAVRQGLWPRMGAGRWLAPAAVLALLVLAVAINPVGFTGAGNDDQHYLTAARCWVAAGGPCLPESHWWSRWPVVAPLAALTGLLGESRATVGLAPLFYWAAALVALWFVARRWFGRDAAWIAVLLMGLTPVFTAAALQPTADNPELAFQLTALAAATLAFDRQSRGWAIAGGFLAGLALQVRDTSVLFLGASALAWLVLDPRRRRVLLWAIPGLLGTVAAEMIVYALASGDPLFRYRLALGHVGIPSAELAASVDTSESPLFNPDYIAGWRREAGVEFWWPLDPWLNLLASARINMTVFAGAVAAVLFGRLLNERERRSVVFLVGLALLMAALLVYGLAIDPKSRMFLPLALTAALVTAAMIARALRGPSRPAALALVAAVAAYQLNALAHYPENYTGEAAAARWIARYPGKIEIDEAARRYLDLLPQGRTLPTKGSGKPLRIAITLGACEALLDKAARSPRLVASAGHDNGRICLFRY